MEAKNYIVIGALIVGLFLLVNQAPKQAGETVVFRQSVMKNSWSTAASGDWIALDIDGDGDLDGYPYATRYTTTSTACTVSGTSTTVLSVKTPEGFNMYKTNDNRYVYVCDTVNTLRIQFDKTKTPAPAYVLSTSPVSPYSSNGQEVYVGGTGVPDTCFQTFTTCANTWVSCQ